VKRLVLGALALGALAACAGPQAATAPGYILYSQHRGNDGSFWYRTEAGPMRLDDCYATLKKVTSRERVGMTKWVDVSMPQLERAFGHPATPTLGSWLACWPDGTRLGEPDR